MTELVANRCPVCMILFWQQFEYGMVVEDVYWLECISRNSLRVYEHIPVLLKAANWTAIRKTLR
jgi:hypothetical protein